MPENSKNIENEQTPNEETIEDCSELIGKESSDSESPKNSYYYDDSYGYELYDPESEEDEESELTDREPNLRFLAMNSFCPLTMIILQK